MRIDPTGIVMVTLVAAGYVFTRYRSPAKTHQAVTVARKSLLAMLPTFVAVFGLVGLFQVCVPPPWWSAGWGGRREVSRG